MNMTIMTEPVFPSIPDRQWDWCAWLCGQEEEGPMGWGKTEQDAKDNLKEFLEEL